MRISLAIEYKNLSNDCEDGINVDFHRDVDSQFPFPEMKSIHH